MSVYIGSGPPPPPMVPYGYGYPPPYGYRQPTPMSPKAAAVVVIGMAALLGAVLIFGKPVKRGYGPSYRPYPSYGPSYGVWF